jgi:hypothetical protein
LSLNSFIPQMWSDQILVQLRKNLVAANLCNRDYEGTVQKMGDTVRINAIGDVTVSSYTKDTAISTPQVLTDAQTTLTIDQAKYFNFAIDDVDKAQQQPKVMEEAMKWAAYRIADQIDQFVLGKYVDAGAAIGTSGAFVTPVVPSQANIGLGTTVWDYFMQLGQYMTQNLCPKQGRWLVVPPWITTLLSQDFRFTSYGTAMANARLQEGVHESALGSYATDAMIGRIAGFDVYESVNSPHLGGTVGIAGSQDVCLAGHPMALTFADGFTETEAYRHPNYFSDAVKSLCLYGARTVRPNALAVAFLQHP